MAQDNAEKRICPWCAEVVHATDSMVFVYPSANAFDAAVTFHNRCAREITEEWYMSQIGRPFSRRPAGAAEKMASIG